MIAAEIGASQWRYLRHGISASCPFAKPGFPLGLPPRARAIGLLAWTVVSVTVPPLANSAQAEASLIDEDSRTHDFGAVIARPGRKLEHRYRLENGTQHEVKIVNVINRKTCCGIVSAGKLRLRPGEATDLTVALLVGDRFGDVTHETEVVTDSSSDPSLVLRTTAQAVPALRVEDATGLRTILVGAADPKRAEFRVFAAGMATDAPLDLDRLTLQSTIAVDWIGPKEASASDDGLTVESRRAVAKLDSIGSPGDRKVEIQIQGASRLSLPVTT